MRLLQEEMAQTLCDLAWFAMPAVLKRSAGEERFEELVGRPSAVNVLALKRNPKVAQK